MELKDWILPLVAAIVGVAALFTDKKKSKTVTMLMLGLLVVSGGVTIAVNGMDSQKTKVKEAKADQRIDKLITISLRSSASIEGIRSSLTSWGLRKDVVATVAKSVQADSARTTTLTALETDSSHRPLIRYFPKEVDGPAVVNALKEANFTVDTTARGRNDNPTNMIWIGDNVSVEDAKFVALTLVRAGVQVKGIRRFLNGGGDKAGLIEVGSYKELNNEVPALTVDAIQNLSSVTRDTEESWRGIIPGR